MKKMVKIENLKDFLSIDREVEVIKFNLELNFDVVVEFLDTHSSSKENAFIMMFNSNGDVVVDYTFKCTYTDFSRFVEILEKTFLNCEDIYKQTYASRKKIKKIDVENYILNSMEKWIERVLQDNQINYERSKDI